MAELSTELVLKEFQIVRENFERANVRHLRASVRLAALKKEEQTRLEQIAQLRAENARIDERICEKQRLNNGLDASINQLIQSRMVVASEITTKTELLKTARSRNRDEEEKEVRELSDFRNMADEGIESVFKKSPHYACAQEKADKLEKLRIEFSKLQGQAKKLAEAEASRKEYTRRMTEKNTFLKGTLSRLNNEYESLVREEENIDARLETMNDDSGYQVQCEDMGVQNNYNEDVDEQVVTLVKNSDAGETVQVRPETPKDFKVPKDHRNVATPVEKSRLGLSAEVERWQSTPVAMASLKGLIKTNTINKLMLSAVENQMPDITPIPAKNLSTTVRQLDFNETRPDQVCGEGDARYSNVHRVEDIVKRCTPSKETFNSSIVDEGESMHVDSHRPESIDKTVGRDGQALTSTSPKGNDFVGDRGTRVNVDAAQGNSFLRSIGRPASVTPSKNKSFESGYSSVVVDSSDNFERRNVRQHDGMSQKSRPSSTDTGITADEYNDRSSITPKKRSLIVDDERKNTDVDSNEFEPVVRSVGHGQKSKTCATSTTPSKNHGFNGGFDAVEKASSSQSEPSCVGHNDEMSYRSRRSPAMPAVSADESKGRSSILPKKRSIDVLDEYKNKDVDSDKFESPTCEAVRNNNFVEFTAKPVKSSERMTLSTPVKVANNTEKPASTKKIGSDNPPAGSFAGFGNDFSNFGSFGGFGRFLAGEESNNLASNGQENGLGFGMASSTNMFSGGWFSGGQQDDQPGFSGFSF